MSLDSESRSFPKSVRHKRILEVAEENPHASLEEIATRVSNATIEVVEEVLDDYGDPIYEDNSTIDSEHSKPTTNETDVHTDESPNETTVSDDSRIDEDMDEEQTTNGTTDNENESDDKTGPDGDLSVDSLSEKHRKLVEAVAAQPEATQQEIADHLNVTRATVSRWANNINGFEWRERESFVETVFDEPHSPDVTLDDESAIETAPTETEQLAPAESSLTKDGNETIDTAANIEANLTNLEERVADLEEAREEETTSGSLGFKDPELVHKIVHACMESETISQSEELRILEELLN